MERETTSSPEIKSGKIFVFTKSGNRVRCVYKTSAKEWKVKRVDTGKEMIVKESALMSVKEFKEEDE